ncbi:MAG: NAD(P)/FAD-dependent oxidoreductase [Sphingomonadaceae bacterium]|nr:NAD(P)/FAD-dependent oxidoreductase [Sphingomonadaceae bacterium]
MAQPIDCVIVGGGPAGLTAAIYLARYHLRVRVIDAGDSRAEWIPLSHNHAGYPDGVSGVDLVHAMRAQAARYGAVVEPGFVQSLAHADGLFRAQTSLGSIAARSVLLATGTVNMGPPMSEEAHSEGLARGLIRYCPVCDGYEATDKRIAVLGAGDRGAREALFLRSYSREVTLIDPEGEPDLSNKRRAELAAAAIRVIPGPVAAVMLDRGQVVIATAHGPLGFDTLYPALGSHVRSELAVMLGVIVSEDHCILVDDHCRAGLAA